jgi:hypothetical protein
MVKLMTCQFRQNTVNYLKQEITMKKKTLIATALTAVITTGLVATALSPVIAAELQEKAAQQTKVAQDSIKVSEDALMTMRNVGSARLALFNGSPAKAQIYTDAAVTRATATLNDADKYALDINASKKDGEKYVPFNAGLTVAETLEPNNERLKAIANSSKPQGKSESQKATEPLKVDEIGVAVSTELLPIQAAKTHIEDAAKLIGEGKYYQANLALKAVQDSVITEIVDTSAIPKNETHS